MDDGDRIVAIGLLSQRNIDALGGSLRTVFPVDQKLVFLDLLLALDDNTTEPRKGETSDASSGAPAVRDVRQASEIQ